jgi:hypothetical protein
MGHKYLTCTQPPTTRGLASMMYCAIRCAAGRATAGVYSSALSRELERSGREGKRVRRVYVARAGCARACSGSMLTPALVAKGSGRRVYV